MTDKTLQHLQEIGNQLWGLEEDCIQALEQGDNAAAEQRREAILGIAHEAYRCYQEKKGPDDLAAYVGALALRMLGRWEEAAEGFRKVTEMDPQNVDAWLELTWCLGEIGDHGAALASARQVVDLAPDLAGGWFNLGLALIRTGDKSEAREALEIACELEPQEPRFREMLANLERELNSETQSR